jgi:hypothetical protein
MVLIGLNDLLADWGIPGEYDHPRVREAYAGTIATCRKRGKHCGVGGLATRPDLVAEFVRMGARYVSTGTDLGFLIGALTARARRHARHAGGDRDRARARHRRGGGAPQRPFRHGGLLCAPGTRRRKLISLVFSNASPAMPPWGARTALLGTNPSPPARRQARIRPSFSTCRRRGRARKDPRAARLRRRSRWAMR